MRPKPRRGASAVLLAAGVSSRFLGTKQLALIRGKTLVERALDAIPREVRETIVVLGYEASAIAEAIGVREGVVVVVNPNYRAGMGGSIRTGVRAVGSDAEGAMVLLSDQPFVTRPLLRRMLREFEKRGARGIVAASSGGLVSPPAIFSRKYFRELAALRGDQGARSVIGKNTKDVTFVRVRSKRTLADIDTRDDLEAAIALLQP